MPNVLLFDPKTPLTGALIEDYSVSDSTLINPSSSLPFLDGEFPFINSDRKLVRGYSASGDYTKFGGDVSQNPAGADAAALQPVYPIFAEKGRSDVQAIGKVPVIRTAPQGLVFDVHSDILPSGETYEYGDLLYVNWQANGSTIARRRVLSKASGTASAGTLEPIARVVKVYNSDNFYTLRVELLPKM